MNTDEEFFLDYIKLAAPIFGVFGKRAEMINDKFIPEDIVYLEISDTLEVVYQHKPYLHGNFYPVITKRIKKYKKAWNANGILDHNIHCIHGDYSIESLIASLMISASLSRSNKPSKLSSQEYEKFKLAVDSYHYSIPRNGESNYGESIIYYNSFTDIGKENIMNCKKFLENNTSLTPIQDAFNEVLLKNKLPTHMPFTRWCELLTMKEIDYSTVEEIKLKRAAKYKKLGIDFERNK